MKKKKKTICHNSKQNYVIYNSYSLNKFLNNKKLKLKLKNSSYKR